MRRITLESKRSHSDTNKAEWKFLFHSLLESVTQDADRLGEYHERVEKICGIVDSLTGKELNSWADKLRANAELQLLYRDGHWLDSPYKYDTKTQQMLDIIYSDLMGEYISKLTKKAVSKC